MFKYLSILLVLFSFTLCSAQEPKIEQEPKKTAQEEVIDKILDKNIEKKPVKINNFLVQINTSAQETFYLQVKASTPREAINSVMNTPSEFIMIFLNIEEDVKVIYINKSQIATIFTSIKPYEHPKAIEKEEKKK